MSFGALALRLVGFTVYFISVEEIHWRIHLGGWLPPGLRRGREYHLAHHDIPDARFNVFLPIFDLVFGNCASKVTPGQWRCLRQRRNRISESNLANLRKVSNLCFLYRADYCVCRVVVRPEGTFQVSIARYLFVQ